MLHSISFSSRTTSTPAIASSYPNNKNSTLLRPTRTATTSTVTAFNSVSPLPLSSLPSLPLSSFPSTLALHPPSTGGTPSIKTTFQATSSFQSNTYSHIPPIPRSQHQFHSFALPPAGYPFTRKSSTYKVRPKLARRLSSSGPSTLSSHSSFFLSSVSTSSSTPSPLLSHSPRQLCTSQQQQQQHYQGSTTATTRFSKPGVRTGAPADTAHFLDERGQPQLLKLSSHHPLLPPPSHFTPSALPIWLSAGGGGTAKGKRLQQLQYLHQHQHQQGRAHHHEKNSRPYGAEYSMAVHGWTEESQQCSVDQQNAIPNSIIITTDTIATSTTATMVIGMPSQSNTMIEMGGKSVGSQCGGEGAVRANEGIHDTISFDDDEGPTDVAGRCSTVKTSTGDLPYHQLPTSPLTPIPTATLCQSSSSSCSSPSLLSLLHHGQPDSSACMTPPSRPSLFVASTSCSPDQHLLPGTTTATTIPLREEVTDPTFIMHETNLEEQVVIHPSTPRSKPKPSPIATKSLRRANSLGLSTTNAATAAQQAENFSNCNTQPVTCGVDGDFLKVFAEGYRRNGVSIGENSCSSDEEEARDSGVVLEPWDQPLLQHQQQHSAGSSEDGILLKPENAPMQQQPRQPFPSFDQLFQPNLDLLDPEILRRRPSDQQSQRRQRCQSMFYPPTPRETELDDKGSRSNDDTDPSVKDYTTSTLNNTHDNGGRECIPSGPSGSSTTPKSSDVKATRRSKRVASMSIGSDHHQHPFIGAHGLPPLPPLATSTSDTLNTTSATTTKPQRSSFFCSPSFHDSAASDSSSSDINSSQDSTERRPSQPPSNDSTSSLSSTFTSTSTATIPLTRPSSPPEQHHSQYHSLVGSFAHGMPFSNMLDLATAKAENITGLYFAKQMNNQPKGSGSMEPGMSTLQGSGEQQEDGQAKQQTRVVTSTESPVTDHTAGSFTGPTDIGKNCAPPVLVLDGVRIPGSPVAATTTSTPAFAGAFQGTPLTPSTKGLHRRSHSASHFFHLSSLKHHSPAQFNLALCYEHGQGGVEQDLAKALHFYQQAADQGHTKASYNLGCICYNQGEISKAMAWFESAGKCGVQGLKVDAGVLSSSSSSSSSVPGGAQKGGVPLLECPMPKATILPHELEDMLMLGDHTSGPEGSAGGGGPFVAYLPAILCLALLCRQGVQTREGEVILRRDPDQAVALLQRLLDRAPARMLNRLEKGHQQSRPQLVRQQPSLSSMSASDSGRSIGVAAKRDPRKRASLQTVPALQKQGGTTTTASSIFSTSCPQLPLGRSSSMSSSSSSCSTPFSGRGGGGVRVKRPSTVEDAMDDDDDDYESSFCPAESRSSKIAQNPRQSSGSCQHYIPDSEEDYQEEEKQYGSDVHEAWSVTLAQQLLKAWQQPPPSKQGRATPGSASTEDDGRIQQRIVRHHLLYITNPTLGKNFYNLGVLYDLYLGHAQIAQRCYRSAYQNCQLCLPPLTPVSVLKDAMLSCAAATDRASKQQQQLQLAGLVTRINSAWNLGVLHAKHQEWSRAKSWFLKAQQDVLAHERIVAASVDSVAQDQRQRREGGRSAVGGEREIVSDLTALLMKQGGGGGDGEEAEWSSKVEELLSLDGSGNSASETKQRRAVVSEKRHRGADVVQQEDMDEFQTRRRSLVNVLPSPAPGGQSNISARGGRGEQRGRSGGRTSDNDGIGARGDALLGTKDSPGSRHAREHGLMMHLSSSSAGSSSSSKRMSGGASSTVKSGGKKGSSSSLSREGGKGGRGSSGGSGGIRTDASKVAWVLRWVESNMDSPSSTSSLSL